MTSIAHLLSLIRARLSRPDPRERLTLEKRRLETLLRQRGISRPVARDICWHFFND